MSETATTTSTNNRNRETQIKAYCNDEETAMADALATLYGASRSAVLRKLVTEDFESEFPDLDPEHITEGRVSDEDLVALAKSDLSVDDLELDEEDDHDQDDRDPASYSATVTPNQLASEGAECSYDTLREAAGDLVDGGYWGEEFEVHPSRVGETTLRQNHKITSRVIAGMVRSQMTNGVVSGELLDEFVEDYAMHLTSRMDEIRGEQHIRNTYGDLVRSHFWRHPHPEKDVYFASKDRYLTAASGILDDLHGPLRGDIPAIFTHKTWEQANGMEIPEQEWHADLGELLKSAVTARRMALDLEAADLDSLEIETLDDAKDSCHHLMLLANRAYDAFQTQVSSYHRLRVEDHHLPCDVGELL